MRENINKVSQRGERLDSLQDKTDNLAVSAQGFRRGANRVRKQMWWKDMKMRVCLVIVVIILINYSCRNQTLSSYTPRMFRRCAFSLSTSQPWLLMSIVLFSFLGTRKRSIGSFGSALHRNKSCYDLHDLILQISYDLEYSSVFSIKCIPSWSPSTSPIPTPFFLSYLHGSCRSSNSRKSSLYPDSERQLAIRMKQIVVLPLNHSTLVHDTFGECLWTFFLFV